MVKDRQQAGFSLTETLLAVGTLAIGLMFISGTFLTGVYFSTTSTERTMAVVAADEAFAKIRLAGVDPNSAALRTGGFALYQPLTGATADEEHLYPSTRLEPRRQYSWSALVRRSSTSRRLVPCTVFVSRQTANNTYWVRQSGNNWPQLETAGLPQPLRVNLVQDAAATDKTVVTLKDALPGDGIDELAFVNDNATLVDDATGQIYRVLERYGSPPDQIRLDRAWAGGTDGWAWVVPPATSGGRNPMIAVYQGVLRVPGNS